MKLRVSSSSLRVSSSGCTAQLTETGARAGPKLEAGSWKLEAVYAHQSESLAPGGSDKPGRLVDYVADDVSPDMSFLEMLDVVNEALIVKGEDPIAFDSDCREGICGTCGFLVSGIPHGPDPGTTVASCTCAASRTATR